MSRCVVVAALLVAFGTTSAHATGKIIGNGLIKDPKQCEQAGGKWKGFLAKKCVEKVPHS